MTASDRTADLWQALIDAEPLAILRDCYAHRRALGSHRLPSGVQRGIGQDVEEALLDALIYASALGWTGEVNAIRTVLVAVVARNGREAP